MSWLFKDILYLVGDVSGQPVCPIFKYKAFPDTLSRNVGNYQTTLRNIPEDRISHSHRGERLKSHMLPASLELNCSNMLPDYTVLCPEKSSSHNYLDINLTS